MPSGAGFPGPGITECTLAASPHIWSLCPPHPRPGEDPASENGQGLPEGAGPIIGVSEGHTSNTVAASPLGLPGLRFRPVSHATSALPGWWLPWTLSAPMHICYWVYARALGPLPPNPCGPHTPAHTHTHTHTHTHVSSPHSHRWSHSLREGPAPRPTQLPPTSYSPPNVRASFGVRSDCSVGKGLGAAVDAVPRNDHGGHDDGQRQPQCQQDQADRGPAALGHGSDRPRGEGRQVGTQLADREVHREAGS